MKYEIDMKDVEKYAEQLAKLHKSAFPTAIRATLNSAAFNVKAKLLADSAKKNFIQRDNNFFKANSTYEKAKGWKVEGMQSEVGMFENKLKNKSTNYAVKDLEQQEHGGKIGGKAFIPMRTARTGRNTKKKVKGNARMEHLNDSDFTPLNRRSAKSRSQQFIRAAIYSLGNKMKNGKLVANGDGYVLGHRTRGGGRTLWKIDSISVNIKTRKMKLKATPLYNVKKNRSIHIVKKTHFMREAAERSAKGMPTKFNREAERQIRKYLR